MRMSADIGVYGLGTMGSALALNFAENGFSVAVSNREPDWIDPFLTEADGLAGDVRGFAELADFVEAIKAPRTILFMIPSGAPMDAMIDTVVPLLSDGDTIIDGGNADFNATRARNDRLNGTGVHFVGMGVSGGAEGARHGPSMMVGGSDHSWAQFRPMAEAIAAKFETDPCVAHVGPDGAGHFVKTVHNGIEYADMQMIAEIYGIQRDMAKRAPADIGAMFARWDEGALHSYLTEIAAKVLTATDEASEKPMVDLIKDAAGQKGTGRWTVIEALKLGQSASAIEAAVGARGWSSELEARRYGEEVLDKGQPTDAPTVADLEAAMLAGRIISHAQGFRVMTTASEAFGWDLDMARIAEIWRAGCIIRSALLDDFSDAFRKEMPHDHMIFAPAIRDRLTSAIQSLRRVVASATLAGQPVPALAAALAWHDSMGQARGTANMIQGLRDFFGAHGFERIDASGTHHGSW
ncbi:NADP-dependent phosphogluconate dehydrogenase [uncultured Tateyamaria sp.]|uniref:NADP-dependent phosphogluconate dehydrogenase n=1 Tax=uncultured Tateyamaria sp. TaxID=455651 RepID=UPI0026372255|nr:NADP-dependent phosphogluconate dehydrogenase [uncultured Tateyamaria sp.]